MIKAAIFDMDGTLTDTMGFWEYAYQEYLSKFDLDQLPGTREDTYQLTIAEAARYINDRYNLGLSEKDVIDGINAVMLFHYNNDAVLKSNLTYALDILKRYSIPLLIASTTDRELIDASLKHTKIESYFEKIFTTSEVGAGKHFPKIYQEAASYCYAKPEETLVFEDAYHAVRTAKKAGFITIGIKDQYCQADEKTMKESCDYYLSDWQDFKVIENLLK